MKQVILLFVLLSAITLQTFAASEIKLVDPSKRSKSFEAVAAKLDLGGEIFNYMDTDGYIEEISSIMGEFMKGIQAMEADMGPQNPAMGFMTQMDTVGKHLGLFNIDAYGMSAYASGDLFHGKAYIHLPEGRDGIFTLLGDGAHEFELLKYAPESTDYFYSTDLTLNRIIPIARAIMSEMMGDMGSSMLDQGLAQPLPEMDMTAGELFSQLDTEVALILSFGKPQPVPQMSPNMPEFEIPQINGTVVIRNLAPLFDKLLQAPEFQSELKMTQSDGFTFYSFPDYETAFPFGKGAAFFATDSKTGIVYLSTSRAYFDACLAKSGGLSKTSEFKTATQGLPEKGNVLNFVSSDVYKLIHDTLEQAKTAMPSETGLVLGFYELVFPMLGATGLEPPSATVGVIEPKGIWFVTNTPFRPTSGAGSEAQVPVVAGLLAAMAIPAFQKVRETSQEKVVINNFRQLVSGGQQYMLEEGVTQATYDDIVGPDKYVRGFSPVMGEDYTKIVIKSEGGKLSVTLSNGKVIEYEY